MNSISALNAETAIKTVDLAQCCKFSYGALLNKSAGLGLENTGPSLIRFAQKLCIWSPDLQDNSWPQAFAPIVADLQSLLSSLFGSISPLKFLSRLEDPFSQAMLSLSFAQSPHAHLVHPNWSLGTQGSQGPQVLYLVESCFTMQKHCVLFYSLCSSFFKIVRLWTWEPLAQSNWWGHRDSEALVL